jgi:hypothetical protein
MAQRYFAAMPASHSSNDRRRTPAHPESGYTLIELLVASLLVPIVVGALAVALVSVLRLQPSTSTRVADSADAQTVSTNFDRDVQSAAVLTTDAAATNPSPCGTGVPVLGLAWSPTPGGQYQSVVTYAVVGSGTSRSLVRQYCAAGATTTPSTITYVSHDIPAGQLAPTVTPGTKGVAAASGWTSTIGVQGVTFNIDEPGSNFTYALTSVPKASTSATAFSNVATPTTTCGFATPGTGSYAATLCFVDFSGYNYRSTSGQCQQMTAGVVNTPYTLSFCLKTSATPTYLTGPACLGNGPALPATVIPCPVPTYFDPPTSEAFLGNNGFYTGVPGDPALYTNAEGSSATVTLTNVQLLDANGHAATNWQLVTGDAESTDAGESITWNSSQLLSLLPNSSASAIGNACADPTPGSGLTGVGTSTVQCVANVSSDKTGTVMLESPAPSALTVNLVGTGLQAVFVGVLLP